MAWAALIPVAMQVLGSMTKKDSPQPGPALPPPPSLGEIFSSNDQKYSQPTNFGPTQGNPFSPIPTGGGSRGLNG